MPRDPHLQSSPVVQGCTKPAFPTSCPRSTREPPSAAAFVRPARRFLRQRSTVRALHAAGASPESAKLTAVPGLAKGIARRDRTDAGASAGSLRGASASPGRSSQRSCFRVTMKAFTIACSCSGPLLCLIKPRRRLDPPNAPMLLIADSTLLCLKTPLHIGVCRFDQLDQRRGIDVTVGPELYVTHVLAGSFQQARRVRELGATEKPDIDMGCERVDLGERRIRDARGRVAVMQQFAYIVSTCADGVEPMACDSAQFTGMLVHPRADCGVSLEGTGEPKNLIHRTDRVITACGARRDRPSCRSGGRCRRQRRPWRGSTIEVATDPVDQGGATSRPLTNPERRGVRPLPQTRPLIHPQTEACRARLQPLTASDWPKANAGTGREVSVRAVGGGMPALQRSQQSPARTGARRPR